MTLTLDPRRVQGDPIKYLNACWAEMRVYLRRHLGRTITFIRVLEFHRTGIPHLHILVSDYLPQSWISAAWQAVGGGRIVDIRMVDTHRVSRYLSKYLTKELMQAEGAGRARRVTSSRNIILIKKPEKIPGWGIVRISIEAEKALARSILGEVIDRDGELWAIELSEPTNGPPG